MLMAPALSSVGPLSTHRNGFEGLEGLNNLQIILTLRFCYKHNYSSSEKGASFFFILEAGSALVYDPAEE
jgi:hypothetical protein